MAVNEEQLLREFQNSGSRDALRDLLIAHQHRIYNACFQVLARAEDAEDAAQEVLMKIAAGARSAHDADSFRGWIYRVSIRTSLDVWRWREATRDRESRAAMNRPSSPPLDDRERIALFEAMDGLEDGERSLLLEHYFEKVPLEALGDRRGISAVAIWKRIDRAREKLKKALLGAGFVAASARLAEALESTVPATAPATLAVETVLGKILAGGVAVGATKSSMIPALVVTLVLLVGISTGGYLVFQSRETATPISPGAETTGRKPDPAPLPSLAAPSDSATAVPEKSELLPPKSKLREQLEKYKLWHAEWRALGRSLSAVAENSERLRLIVEKTDEAGKLLEGARALIFEDPKIFLDFLRDPANEEYCEMLIGHALDNIRMIDGASVVWRQKFTDFPQPLLDGFLDLLKTGTPGQKAPLLRFLIQVDGVAEDFDSQYVALMMDPNPGVQAGAIAALSRYRALPPAILEQVRQVYESSGDPGVRVAALGAICRTDTEEVQRWMVSRLESRRDPEMVRPLAQASRNSLMGRMDVDEKTVDRHAAALTAAAKVPTNENAYHDLVLASVMLPANRALGVLETALPNAPNPKYAGAVSKLLEKIRAGGTNWKTLMMDFQSLLSKN